MDKEIIFYDLPCTHPAKFWSPHTSKTRYLLNLLHVNFRVEWVTFEELLPKFSALGVPPNDFYPTYWLPTIQLMDGTFVCTSENILEHFIKYQKLEIYPDQQYQRFSEKFVEWFEIDGTEEIKGLLMYVTTPFTELVLTTRGAQKYFTETKGETVLGKELSVCREDAFSIEMYCSQAYEFLNNLQEEFPSYRGFDRDRFMTGPYLYGNKITYADIVLAATLTWPIHVSEAQSMHFFNVEDLSPWLGAWYKRIMAELSGETEK